METIFSIFRECFELTFWIKIIFIWVLLVIGLKLDFLVRYIGSKIIDFERDNNEELTPMQILNLIRPKEGWKFDITPRNFIFEDDFLDENSSQDDFNLIINQIADEVLLLLIKAGSNGLNVEDVRSEYQFARQPDFASISGLGLGPLEENMNPLSFRFPSKFVLSSKFSTSADYDSISPESLAKTILCHLHKQSIVIITRRSRDDCNYRLKDLDKLIFDCQNQHQWPSKSQLPRKIIPRTKKFKNRRDLTK